MVPHRDHFSNDCKTCHKNERPRTFETAGTLSYCCPSKTLSLHQVSLIKKLFEENATLMEIKNKEVEF